MSYTTDAWTAIDGLEALIRSDRLLKTLIIRRLPFERDVFSGNNLILIYPVNASIEDRGVGLNSTIDAITVEARIITPARSETDLDSAKGYNKALKDLINANPTLGTSGVVSCSITSEDWGYFMDDMITYISNTIRIELQII